jgi:dTDP-4-dehydrorhamnose 3,5-epimerase
VVKGSIVDFMVDLETGEVDFCEVRDTGAVFIPNTKAHGFLTLEPNTIVVYMVEGNYNPQSEHSIVWSDNPKVSEVIKSYIGDHELTISEKDKLGK